MHGDSIFDAKFNGMGGSEMYRAQIVPDLFPHEKPMLIDNWPEEDRLLFCGGEAAKEFYRNEIEKRGAA
ncbi:hypothetical protein AVT20_gp44 [Mycobacterium phage Tiffany]|uniref:hypothetical protein n=1 Tax=Mycobacterium phage Tiffany TaxID=1527535 RepID=UPI0004EF8844|nr:hypothetical protein AVT20_gp44 [Mycobacterium phage Tiffany]AIK69005.1 hypothetical protein PBI_TIFFANY_55 [Mycobacterium phage Tiffany]